MPAPKGTKTTYATAPKPEKPKARPAKKTAPKPSLDFRDITMAPLTSHRTKPLEVFCGRDAGPVWKVEGTKLDDVDVVLMRRWEINAELCIKLCKHWFQVAEVSETDP